MSRVRRLGPDKTDTQQWHARWVDLVTLGCQELLGLNFSLQPETFLATVHYLFGFLRQGLTIYHSLPLINS